jgi:hypothetical protein
LLSAETPESKKPQSLRDERPDERPLVTSLPASQPPSLPAFRNYELLIVFVMIVLVWICFTHRPLRSRFTQLNKI